MSLLTRLSRFAQPAPTKKQAQHAAEVEHWNEVARRVNAGERLFWLSHPRVHELHRRRMLLDGLDWREWVVQQLGSPAEAALELGCGQGGQVKALVEGGFARSGVGIDLDDSRFREDALSNPAVQLRAADLDVIQMEQGKYDLIYSLQSFHHFDALEHIMEQASGALTDRGYFILDEFVGPRRFQWTDLQLSVTEELLALIPKSFRLYTNGVEKRAEGRSTPEEVIRVCPSEAIRSDDILPLFRKYFDVVHEQSLGGTIQHILYSGIVHNFPDNVPDVDRMIDSIDSLEQRMISCGMLTSDFVLLVGKKKQLPA